MVPLHDSQHVVVVMVMAICYHLQLRNFVISALAEGAEWLSFNRFNTLHILTPMAGTMVVIRAHTHSPTHTHMCSHISLQRKDTPETIVLKVTQGLHKNEHFEVSLCLGETC